MNDQQQQQSPASHAGGFVVPTVSPEGQPMSARDQYQHMLRNPDWSRAAVETGTQARGQLDDMNRRMAADLESTEVNPVLALEPAKEISEYRLGIDVTAGPEVQAFDVSARTWLHAMGAPVEFGSSLTQQVESVARKLSGADQTTRDLYAQKSRRALEQVYGADTDKQIAKVDAFLDDVVEPKAPGLGEFLVENSFILGDAMIIQYLIQLADAHANRGAAGGRDEASTGCSGAGRDGGRAARAIAFDRRPI